MLHITSSKIKLAQDFNEEKFEKHREPRYYGNPMGITAQCVGCGASYKDVHGELHPCEWCQKNFCPTCSGPHKAAHMQESEGL